MNNAYFVDIDGTLIKDFGNMHEQLTKSPELLPGVMEKLEKWMKEDVKIILTTARRESMREITEYQLKQVGIPYDMLIMGIGRGKRVVINDLKPNSYEGTAFAYNPERNVGLADCPH